MVWITTLFTMPKFHITTVVLCFPNLKFLNGYKGITIFSAIQLNCLRHLLGLAFLAMNCLLSVTSAKCSIRTLHCSLKLHGPLNSSIAQYLCCVSLPHFLESRFSWIPIPPLSRVGWKELVGHMECRHEAAAFTLRRSVSGHQWQNWCKKCLWIPNCPHHSDSTSRSSF